MAPRVDKQKPTTKANPLSKTQQKKKERKVKRIKAKADRAAIKKKTPAKQSLKIGNIRYGRMKRALIKKLVPTVKKVKKVKKAPLYITKPIGGEKNGSTRTVLVQKPPSYYPVEERKKKKRAVIKKLSAPRLRNTLTPGTLCIVLVGPHKGKRVVFLKQLESGLCLITGPYTVNMCPLRRINQSFLIGTSTKVDLGEFVVPEHLNDDYFRRVKLNKKKPKKEEGDIFSSKAKKFLPSDARKADQKTVDTTILKCIKKNKEKKALLAYMSNKFFLRSRTYPHLLKF